LEIRLLEWDIKEDDSLRLKHLEDGTEEKDEMTIKLNKELAELEQLNDKLEMMIVYTRYLISLNN